MTDIQIDGQSLVVRFDAFDIDAYRRFLQCKHLPEFEVQFDHTTETYAVRAPARFASMLDDAVAAAGSGAELTLAPHLWDYQRYHARQAFEARRFALWWDCGLGKTPTFLEWARLVMEETGGRVLILTLNAELIAETKRMATMFYGDALPIAPLPTRAELRAWCVCAGPAIGIATYTKLLPPQGERAPNAGVIPEFRYLAGIVSDESSILRSGGGVIKWNLIHSARGVPYKLSCTATPAPNDPMEYASQASFLEKLRTEGEILWTFFNRDAEGEWHVKHHARAAFYRFLAGWSSYLRTPAAFGWDDNLSSIPKPIERVHRVVATPEQLAAMSTLFCRDGELLPSRGMGVVERGKAAQIAKGFLYEGEDERSARLIASGKPGRVAELVAEHHVAGRQVLVWTEYNEEARLIVDALMDVVPVDAIALLDGRTPAKQRERLIERFRIGELPVLVAKPAMLGYGLNLPKCSAHVWSGFSDSFERLFQATRRSLRYGKTDPLYIDMVLVPECEGAIYDNLSAKRVQFDADAAEQEHFYLAAIRELRGAAAA